MKKVLPVLAVMLVFGHATWGQTNEKADQGDTAKKRQLITDERYVGIGLGYVAGLSANAPYKAGVNLHDVFGRPVLKRRLVVEGQLDFDFRFGHNREWNTRAYNGWRPSFLPDVFNFLSADFTLGAYPVIVNNSNFSVVAGPMVGIANISARSASGDIMMLDGKRSVFTLCYGLKASFLLGPHLMMSAQYFMTPITEAETVAPGFPVTFNALRICGTYHYLASSSWLYKRMMARKAKRKAAITAAGSSQ